MHFQDSDFIKKHLLMMDIIGILYILINFSFKKG